jgi:hypothetical protein
LYGFLVSSVYGASSDLIIVSENFIVLLIATLSLIPISVLSHLLLGLPSSHFPRVFQPKFCTHFLSLPILVKWPPCCNFLISLS